MVTLFDMYPQGTVFKPQCQHPWNDPGQAQLSRMTHSYHTEYIISQYVGQKGVQIPPSVKRKRR